MTMAELTAENRPACEYGQCDMMIKGHDVFTMYERKTTEYDTEYMNKYNEDLNTTLVFVSFELGVIVLDWLEYIRRASCMLCARVSLRYILGP